MTALTRDVPLDPAQSCLLFVDVQNFAVKRNGGEFAHLSDAEFEEKYGWYFRELEARVIPNMQRLQKAARAADSRGHVYDDREPDPRWPRSQPRLQDHRLQCAEGLVGRQGDRRDRTGRVMKSGCPNHHRASSSRRISITSCAISASGKLVISGPHHRSMRRIRHPRCLRSRLSRDAGDRCLPDL